MFTLLLVFAIIGSVFSILIVIGMLGAVYANYLIKQEAYLERKKQYEDKYLMTYTGE